MQFENVSYGIEPLESAFEFQHLLYKLGNGKNEFTVLTENKEDTEQNPMDYNIFISEKVSCACFITLSRQYCFYLFLKEIY